MAGGSLGTLTLDLIAKIGGFTGPLDKASRESQKQMKAIQKAAEVAGAALGTAIAGGATLATAALTAMVSKQLDVISDQDDLAHRLRTTVGSLGVLTRAGELSGVGLDQLTNGSQKLELALGKAAQGSKAQVQAFDRLGLSYKTVAELPIDERIAAINDALAENVPEYERSAVAAALFGAKNAAAFQQLDSDTLAEANRQITIFGVKLTDIDSSKVEAAGDAITIFKLAMDGVAKQVTVQLSPVIVQLSKDFTDSAESAGGLGTAVKSTTRSVLEAISFIVDAGAGVGRVFSIVSAEFDGLVSSAAGSIIAGVFQTLTLLDKLPGVDLSGALGDLESNYNKQVAAAEDATKRMRDALETPLAGTAFLAYYDKAQVAAEAAAKSAVEGQGSELKAAALTGEQYAALAKSREDDAAAAKAHAKELLKAVDTTEEGYQRQIALINTTSDVQNNATEVAKLAFEVTSGKLVGINSLQQKRLDDLAKELDRLNKIKKANEDAKKLATFGATLDEGNQTAQDGFDLDLAGAGQGDKYKQRLRETLSIQQDFNKQMRDLQSQHNTGEISDGLYASEQEKLDEALAKRLVSQQDYYNQVDEAQSEWMDGVHSAWQNYVDYAEDYSQQAADATASVLSDATSGLGTFLSDVASGAESAGDALGDLVANFAKSTLKTLADMAAQWLVYQAVQLVVGKTTQSTAGIAMVANAQATAFQASLAAYASTAAIPIVGPAAAPAAAFAAAAATAPMVAGVASAALAGMAHSGMDNIPKEGTWLLDGGERIVTPEQNKDLTRFLNSSDSASGSVGGATISINAPITVQAQQGVSDQDAQRQGQQMSQALTSEVIRILQAEMGQGGVLWRKV